ncbi:MAG: hypothetical protein V3V30_06410 [Parvularculaceae bacterium]
MKNSITALAVMIFVSFMLAGTSAVAASGEVVGTMEAYLVSRSASGQEQFSPAKRVTPGGVIEYRVTYKNETQKSLSEFVINGKVPTNTVFVDDQSRTTQGAVLEADVAELGWVSLPAFRDVKRDDGSVQRVRVAPNEYGAVRWRLKKAIDPGSQVTAIYRVSVNK